MPQLQLIERLLVPVIRLCLRRSILLPDFVELTKRVYVRLAEEEIRKSTDLITASRVSLLTGLYRRDVQRLIHSKDVPQRTEISLTSRVIGKWEADRRFQEKKGGPRALSYKGEKSEFYRLVRALSTTINPTTVLFELERNGAVEITPDGAKLIRSTEKILADENRILNHVADEFEALLRATENNLRVTKTVGDLHIRTQYDNLYLHNMSEIRHWLFEKGREFHREARLYLSAFDKDVSPRSDGPAIAGGRVTLSAFSSTDPPPSDELSAPE